MDKPAKTIVLLLSDILPYSFWVWRKHEEAGEDCSGKPDDELIEAALTSMLSALKSRMFLSFTKYHV